MRIVETACENESDGRTCDATRRLLEQMAGDDVDIDRGESDAMALHVAQCPACEAFFHHSFGLIARADCQTSGTADAQFSVDHAWHDLLRRCPELASAQRGGAWTQRIGRLLLQPAIAACLVALLLGGVLTAIARMLWQAGPTASATASLASPDVQVVTADGRQNWPVGRQITTDAARCEVLLVGLHRVVLNRHTSVTFHVRPGSGPEIQLAGGELYVEVVPGHRFTVLTDNARLAITGTKFNVQAAGERTDLTLLEGSIRFGGRGAGEPQLVSAGFASTIHGQRPPAPVRPIDATAVTAWARSDRLVEAHGGEGRRLTASDARQIHELLLSMRGRSLAGVRPAQIEPADYALWRDSHQDWFARQFPWIFRVKASLDQQLPEPCDYLDLLMISGDLWQFHYDPSLRWDQRFARPDPGAIARLAVQFKVDQRDLLKEALLSDPSSVSRRAQGEQSAPSAADALRAWHVGLTASATLPPQIDQTLLFNSASIYLTNTRTASYLWTASHPDLARKLFADPGYPATGALPHPPRDDADADSLRSQLRDDAESAHVVSVLARELLEMPTVGGDCIELAAQHRQKLAHQLAELIPQTPPESSRPEGGKR